VLTSRSVLARLPFFYGWVIVGVATFAMFAATLTGGAGFSVFIAPMSRDLGWSRSMLVGTISAGTIVGALLAPFMGRLIDRFGARLALTLCGAGVAVTLTLVAGVTTELMFLFAYGAARAIDMGALNLAVTTAVANWFVRMRGRALGIATAGNAIGVMLLVPLIQWMIDGPGGWRMAWLVVGAGSGAVLMVAALVLVRRRPEDLGLLPDGDTARPVVAGAAVTGVTPVPAAEVAWTARLAARSPSFWLVVAATCASQFAGTGLTTHQTALLAGNGLDPMTVAGAIGLYGFIWTASTMTWGVLVERVPARVVLGLVSVFVACCCAGALLVRESWMLLVYVAAYGIIGGARDALDATVWADFFGREAVGAIRGLSRPFVVGSGALGALAGGIGYDLAGDYTAIMLTLAAISLTGLVAAVVVSPPRSRASAVG
jgi:MFS transporter, OFA family, oxalate/formate antiporter